MTMLGAAHGPAAGLQTMAMLQQQVRPSDTLFVFPYRPMVYFLTLARNPTRYSFLQPGMFPESDAQRAASLDGLYGYPRFGVPPHLARKRSLPDAHVGN